jgi:hypothetical protein
MIQAGDEVKQIGRARRVTGIAFLALGTIICLRAAWLFVFYRLGFARDEWIRFVFWVWLGLLLTLVGCWLKFRWRAAAWFAALSVPALFALAYLADRLGQ